MNEHLIIQVAKILQNIYKSNVKEKLISISQQIEESLEKTFANFAIDFDLTHSNSVYKNKKIYSFTSRVKDDKSFYEKLHRKNIIFSLVDELSIKKTEDIDKDVIINKIINDFHDNIGFRIICDLEEDVKNAYELIKNKEDEFENIKFQNIKNQPEPMKNGHSIYKLNCFFNEIPFELQIKSKFDSAWADMEHDLYYKDNKIDVVKEINKISFNHVGNMLKQIDEYMSQLRKMNNNNDINTKDIEILSQIESRYIKPLAIAISDDFVFNFSDISKQLLFMIGIKITENAHTNVQIKRTIEALLNNKQMRHDSWPIIILEAIYYDIIEDDEAHFIECYFNFILKEINLDPDNELKFLIEIVYYEALRNMSGSHHLLKIEKYKELYEYGKLINDIITNEIELDEHVEIKKLYEYYGYKIFELNKESDLIKNEKELIENIDNLLSSKNKVIKVGLN